MPLVQMAIVSILMLTPPLYAIGIVVFDTNTNPNFRSIRALGSSLILKTNILFVLCIFGFLMHPSFNYIIPVLLFILIGVGSIKIIRVFSKTDFVK